MPLADYGSDYQFPPGSRCDIRQYHALMRCSRGEDIEQWNARRRGRPDEELWLCGIELAKAQLDGVNLSDAHLEGSVLTGVHMEKAILSGAHLEGAVLWQAHLEGANFWQAHLTGAKLWRAHLPRAALLHARADDAFFREADLQRADLSHADLQGAVFANARLQGAKLEDAKLQGADLQFALVNGSTRIADCEVDHDTDFTGVGIEAGRIEPGLTELLRYNIRRKRWQAWYDAGPKWRCVLKRAFVGSFWWMSDYGRSMARIIVTFTVLAVAFAAVYYCFPKWLDGLNRSRGPIGALHALYYSVVTMTTLGFGEVHPRDDAWIGQILLMIQVTMGYVMLGALVTRLSVLFTAGGPEANFTRRKRRKPGEREERPTLGPSFRQGSPRS